MELRIDAFRLLHVLLGHYRCFSNRDVSTSTRRVRCQRGPESPVFQESVPSGEEMSVPLVDVFTTDANTSEPLHATPNCAMAILQINLGMTGIIGQTCLELCPQGERFYKQ